MKSETLLTCTICPAEFKTQRGLDNHKCRWFCKKCGNKFKTAKGYDKHVLILCGNDKVAAARKKEQERLENTVREFTSTWAELQEKGLFNPKYEVGDQVFVSAYYVTKPIYEQRGSRRVKMRYEEERRYFAEKKNIEKVVYPDYNQIYSMKYCIESNRQFPVEYNVGYHNVILKIFDNLEEAKAHSDEASKNYKEHCEHASFCR